MAKDNKETGRADNIFVSARTNKRHHHQREGKATPWQLAAALALGVAHASGAE
jgi:hypothetical protein